LPDLYQEALQRAHQAEARALEAEEQIAKEKRYFSTQWNFSVHYQNMSREFQQEVNQLQGQLYTEKNFSDIMKEGYTRYLRITKHLVGREMAHIQRMDMKRQLWRVSDHCKTRIELYVSKAYDEMRAAAGR
jgi:hypothetical protein